jgi:YegS/Rv2252/BmrU family lipid kinase
LKNKVSLIYNPVAGQGLFKYKLDYVIEQFQKSGLQVIPWRIKRNKEIIQYLKGIDPDDYHTIIAAGGDGTIHEVINGLMKTELKVPLGIFPEGTSNDIATFLGISEDVNKYCQAVIEGGTLSIDLGMANDKYFVNVASAGFLTETAHEVDHHMKNALGKAAYYLKGIEEIPKIKPIELHLNVDGVAYDLEVLLFLILNGGNVGGFKGILPYEKIVDGKLNFLAIKPVPVYKLPPLLFKLGRGQLLKDENVINFEGEKFLIEVSPDIPTDLDGEKGPELPWKASIIPQALQVRTINYFHSSYQ